MNQPAPVPSRPRIPTSAYKMAVFTIVTVVLLGILAVLIGNISFAPSRSFYAQFTDATGVTRGDRVRLSGVEVGRVTGVELDGVGDQQVATVSFTVDEAVPLYENATFALRYENIVGQRYLEITEEPGAGPTLEEGATIPVSRTTPALNLTVLFNGFQPLFRALEPTQVNRLASLVLQAVQGDGSTYQSLLESTARFTNELADKDAVIGRVVDNLGTVLRTVDERDTKLTELIITFRSLMTGLAGDRDTIATSLPGLANLLTVSTGLVGDVRGPLAADIRALDDLAGKLDRSRGTLAEVLQRMPRRLRALARTGSYSSAFNFYLCGISMNLRLLGDDYLLQSPNLAANERDTVCARGAE